MTKQVTFGTEAQFLSNTHSTGWSDYLDSTHFVVAYNDSGDSNKGKVVIGTISGTSISFGTAVEFSSTTPGYIVVKRLTDTTFVVCYKNGNYVCGKVGTVSGGNSISLGSEASTTASNNLYLQIDSFSSSKFIIGLVSGSGAHPAYIVGNISETTITFGSVTDVANLEGYYCLPICTDSTKVSFTYQIESNGNRYCYVKTGTVSGTSISFGTAHTWASNLDIYSNCKRGIKIDTDKFLFSYSRDKQERCRVVTISGTTPTIGAEQTIGSGELSCPYLISTSSILFAMDSSSTNNGKVVYGTIDGTTIIFETAIEFNNNRSGVIRGATYDTDKIFITFKDAGNSNYGTAIIGTISDAITFIPQIIMM